MTGKADRVDGDSARSFRGRNIRGNSRQLQPRRREGNFGAGANSPFPFVYACEGEEPALYLIEPGKELRKVDPESITID